MNRQRNPVIDAARAASIIVVVFYHGLLYQIRLTPGGFAVQPWAAPVWLYPLTWILMIMPLFFVAAGFANALTLDRMRRTGGTYNSYLSGRIRRLIGPVLLFVTFSAVVSTAGALAVGTEEAATLSRQFMNLLWFLGVYLVIVGLAPAMVCLHDSLRWWPLVILVLVAGTVDALAFGSGNLRLLDVNFFVVWLFVHQLGIAYERGWFRSGPSWTPWVALVAGAGVVAYLIWFAGYPPSSVAFADLPVANTQPPTVAMAALAVAQCGLLGLVERSGVLSQESERAQRRLGLVNAYMLTTYLWHILAIIMAGGLLALISWAVPSLAGFTLNQLTVAIVGIAMAVVLIPQIARAELRLTPPEGKPASTARVLVAYFLLVGGVLAVWSFGAVLLPWTPASAAAVLLVWAGCWFTRRSLARGDARTGVAQ